MKQLPIVSLVCSLVVVNLSGCTADTGEPQQPPAEGDVIVLDKPGDSGKADSTAAEFSLHFYPKLISWLDHDEQTGVVVVEQAGVAIFATDARGGPAIAQGTADPTPAGTYKISQIEPKAGSNRWPMSLVRWGATLSVDEDANGRVTAVYEHYTDMAGQAQTQQLPHYKLTKVNTADFPTNVGLVFEDSDQNGTIDPAEMTVDNMQLADYVKSNAPIYLNDFGHLSAYLGNSVFIHPTSGMYDKVKLDR